MTNTKRLLSLCAAALMLAGITGCSNGETSSTADSSNVTSGSTDNQSSAAEESGKTLDSDIVVISREDAEISQSTSVVLQSVKDDVDAIGYISLGSLNDTVKAIKVDGVEPTVDDILAGSYKVARPFVIAVREGDLSELGADFVKFIMSDEGQAIVEQEKYISVGSNGAYTSSGLTGKVVLSGSTSVSPVMEVLADAYKELNSGVDIEVQQTGSGAGITAVTEGACDIGMSSRALKDEELANGLTATTIANDGIAVIVNTENPVDNLTSEQIMNIYTGNINSWKEIG